MLTVVRWHHKNTFHHPSIPFVSAVLIRLGGAARRRDMTCTTGEKKTAKGLSTEQMHNVGVGLERDLRGSYVWPSFSFSLIC
jgi:hypothetical protein